MNNDQKNTESEKQILASGRDIEPAAGGVTKERGSTGQSSQYQTESLVTHQAEGEQQENEPMRSIAQTDCIECNEPKPADEC